MRCQRPRPKQPDSLKEQLSIEEYTKRFIETFQDEYSEKKLAEKLGKAAESEERDSEEGSGKLKQGWRLCF